MKVSFRFFTPVFVISLALALCDSSALAQQTPSLLGGMQQSAALDLLAPLPIQNGAPDGDRFRLRSAEFSFFGAVDPMFDARLTVVGEDDGGNIEFGVEEGYLASNKLIPMSRFRLGKMLLGFGRLNQFHPHDWPFISTPLVQQRFFAQSSEFFTGEGVSDTGAEYSILLPLPFYLDLTLGVSNGYCFGECATGGAKPLAPTHYLHPVFFSELEDGGGIQYGLSYIGRTDADGSLMRVFGGDLTMKRREGKVLSWLVQSEVYHRYLKPSELPLQEQVGGYIFAQKGLDEQWSAGVRVDGFSDLSLTNAEGSHRKNLIYSFAPIISYRASEFSTVRAEYAYLNETREGDSDRPVQSIMLQFIGILGAHPAHDF